VVPSKGSLTCSRCFPLDKIPKYNSALKLFWWRWGETDIARTNGLAVIDKFKSQGVKIEARESLGGHAWDNWRLYLFEVATAVSVNRLPPLPRRCDRPSLCWAVVVLFPSLQPLLGRLRCTCFVPDTQVSSGFGGF
jgi:hypothetical protein